MRPIDADYVLSALSGLTDRENGDEHFLNGVEVAREVITNAQTIGDWISVKDRLPERYERILTYDKYHGVKENWLLRSCPGVSWSYGFHVTHWMPLPEPPKEVKQNDK